MLDLFLAAFVTFFVVIDPPGVAPMFASLTQDMTRDWRRAMAFKSVFIATLILMGFAFGGQWLLDKLHVSLDAFRIAGGMLLFLIAVDMLFEKQTQRREERNQKVIDERKAHPGEHDDISVFPLAIPLIAGPGAIATMILYFTQNDGALERGMYAPGSFDVITLWDVIEHVPDPRAVLEMAAELLAPGGVMMVKTPNCDGLYPRLSLALAGRLGFWGHPDPPGHLFQFSVSTLSRMVHAVGLRACAVHHGRIPIEYSFGKPAGWFRSAKWAAYCVMFLPLAWAGPLLRQGDDFTVVARRP